LFVQVGLNIHFELDIVGKSLHTLIFLFIQSSLHNPFTEQYFTYKPSW